MSPLRALRPFFLQLAVVFVAWIARRLGQPPVLGEMIAGAALGPSLFGLLAPTPQARLFPPASRPILFSGAQLGLVL